MMRTAWMKRVATVVVVLPSLAYAQSDCSEILQRGVYDLFSYSSASLSTKAATASLCQSSDLQDFKKTGGSAGASFGPFGGSASWNDTQYKAAKAAMCQQNSQSEWDQADQKSVSQIVSPAVVDAWKSCQKEANRGLSIDTNYGYDTRSTLIVTLNYSSAAGRASSIEIQGWEVQPAGAMDCAGWRSDEKVVLDASSAKILTCTRPLANEAKRPRPTDPPEYAPATSLIIKTSAGPIIRGLSAAYAPDARLALEVAVDTAIARSKAAAAQADALATIQPRLDCQTVQTVGQKTAMGAFTVTAVKSANDPQYTLVTGGCAVFGNGHSLILAENGPAPGANKGWRCTAADQANIPLTGTVQATAVYCRVNPLNKP